MAMEIVLTKFVYKDSKGKITTRYLAKISEQGIYLQGICHNDNKFKTFRKDRIVEMIDNPNKIDLSNINIPLARHTVSAIKTYNDHLNEVCFTGFNKQAKNKLTELAKSRGLTVRKSVTVELNFLCCGDTAGPSKIDKAREQGVIALNENEFISLLKTGELPTS